MTQWQVIHGDILDVQADGLICSANPHLNLSGGVGGAILLRYGTQMQDYLHEYLRQQNRHYVQPCAVVVCPPFGTSFNAVAHAVAIDGFYGTSIDRITETYIIAINNLLAMDCRTIAATCLGCGFGRCSKEDFKVAMEKVMQSKFDSLDKMFWVTTDKSLADVLAEVV